MIVGMIIKSILSRVKILFLTPFSPNLGTECDNEDSKRCDLVGEVFNGM